MPVDLGVKVGIVLMGTAVTAAGGYTIYEFIIPSTIGDELSKESLTLLNANSDNWGKLVEQYKKSNGENDPKKIKDLELNSDDEKNKSLLQEKCQSLWNTKLTNEEKSRIKDEIKNWCIENPKALATSQSKE